MTRRTAIKWVSLLLADLTLAVAILFTSLMWPRQLVLLDRGTHRPDWLNVTPGCSDSVPLLSELRYSPWPLPRDQNYGAVTWVSLAEPVTLKGKPNQVRYWSFTFYPLNGANHNGALPMIDSERVTRARDGSYVITFAAAGSRSPGDRPGNVGGTNCVDTGDASGGLLFMRNYVPVMGSTIHLPEVWWGDRLMVPAREHYHE